MERLSDVDLDEHERFASQAGGDYRMVPKDVVSLVSEVKRQRQDLKRLVDLAHAFGWNGVENPKAIWDFFEAKMKGEFQDQNDPDPKIAVAAMARSLLSMMDQEPGVVNMLGMEFIDDATGRIVQVTLEYVKPGNKSPARIMNEMRAEIDSLTSKLAEAVKAGMSGGH